MKNQPIAWSAACTPKNKGGLGIRPSPWFNKAVLAKLGWKILTDPNNWWVKLVTAKYLKRKSSNDSFSWKGILDSKELLTKGNCWK